MAKKLLFTDLDGTLLDLATYSFETVVPMVRQLQAAEVAIIFTSSKTWKEQEYYQRALNINDPAIVENGSGIILPDGFDWKLPQPPLQQIRGRKAIALGAPYSTIVLALEESVTQYNAALKYYKNCSLSEIAKLTGLTEIASERARDRDFSETVFNSKEHKELFTKIADELKKSGLQSTPGSKFVTISGVESDKGKAVKLVTEAYQTLHDDVVSYGIGDSRNDQEMLNAVDHPCLVQRPDNTWAEMNVDHLEKIPEVGPAGWNQLAASILAD